MDDTGFIADDKGTAPSEAQGMDAVRRPLTVLLAEDEPDIRYLVALYLEVNGYVVIAVGDGEAAVQEFAKRRDEIDFLLFDLIMPHKNGWKAYQEISRLRPGIPHLFMSGFMGNVLKEAPAESGKETIVIRKPFVLAELLELMGSLLRQSAKVEVEHPISG